jgi:hypothetical protein
MLRYSTIAAVTLLLFHISDRQLQLQARRYPMSQCRSHMLHAKLSERECISAMQVTFQNNTGQVGALYLEQCTATMTGRTSFLSNAGSVGGVATQGSTLDIKGPLCAQDNT